MDKFYGAVGYAEVVKTSAGVFDEHLVEKTYYGDIIKRSGRFQSAESINDELRMTNQISIVADPYAKQNYSSMRYVTLENSKWKVISIDIEYPRLIITVGGLYHGPT